MANKRVKPASDQYAGTPKSAARAYAQQTRTNRAVKQPVTGGRSAAASYVARRSNAAANTNVAKNQVARHVAPKRQVVVASDAQRANARVQAGKKKLR